MLFVLHRLFTKGRLYAPMLRWSKPLVGTFSVREDRDELRNRTTLVARFQVPDVPQEVPPLYDASLVSADVDAWVFTGNERITAGPLQELYVLGQAWHLRPGPTVELERVENEWARAAQELHALRQQREAREPNPPTIPPNG